MPEAKGSPPWGPSPICGWRAPDVFLLHTKTRHSTECRAFFFVGLCPLFFVAQTDHVIQADVIVGGQLDEQVHG